MSDTATSAPSATPTAQSGAETKQTAETQTSATAQAEAVQDIVDDVADVVEDSGTDAEATEKKVEQLAKKLHKLKVGGKEIEVDESELLKRAQMGYSADEKWQEAAKMRKQVEQFISLLQQDPGSALEQLGFNVDELAENRIKARIEEMKKSPEQLERERIEKELKALKEEREREKEEARQRELQQLQDKFASEIENDINSALDSATTGLPKSPYVIKRIADTLILAMQEGRRTGNKELMQVKAADVLPFVQDEILAELNQMYAVAPDEVFEKLVGKDRLTNYRKSKVKKPSVKAPTAVTQDIKSTGEKEIQAQSNSKKNQKMKAKDFFKKLGSF